MERTENRVAEMTVCPVCGGDNSEACGGNDWFCAVHYAAAVAQRNAEYEARKAELAAQRSRAAKEAAKTRAIRKTWEAGADVDCTVFRDGKRALPRRKNMGKYREIKARLTGRA